MESVKLPSVNYLGEEQMVTTRSFSGHASRADLQRRCQDKTGIDGITLNIAARTVWVYTKPVTAAVSTQLKTMSHIHTSNPQGIPSNMINISTWQCADNAVKDNLIREKVLGLQELSDSISGDQQKTTQNASRKKSKHQPAGPRKSDEVAALLRMTQIIASGGEVDIVNFIGNHECINTPPSLFNEDGTTSAAGTKANLDKVLREETGVSAVPNLQQHNLKTAVVVDAFYALLRR